MQLLRAAHWTAAAGALETQSALSKRHNPTRTCSTIEPRSYATWPGGGRPKIVAVATLLQSSAHAIVVRKGSGIERCVHAVLAAHCCCCMAC